MCPLRLMARAMLLDPPSVPRSRIRPFSHKQAWVWPFGNCADPTIWPASLMPQAMLFLPPRVPRFGHMAVFPDKGVVILRRHVRLSHHLAPVVERIGPAARPA